MLKIGSVNFVKYLFCSIYTDVEDMKEQEAANNIMSELLENYSDFFGTEEFLPTDISNSFCVEVTQFVKFIYLKFHVSWGQNLNEAFS